MKTHLVAIALILLAGLWRGLAVFEPSLFNFAPVSALAFCCAVFLRDRRWWLVPFAALTLSDLWLDYYHASRFGYTWSPGEMVLRAASIAAALGIGRLVAQRRNASTLLCGALGSSLVFYFTTNTVAWAGDMFYPGTLAGWWQAMTVGHPEFQPTLWFYRNTLLGDLFFTGVFVAAMHGLAARDARGFMSRNPA